MIKLSDFVFDFVAAQGVKDVFLLPGGGCMHLVDSLGSNRQITQHALLHEQAVAIAADAYSQYTQHLGVALVTTGPGGTNAITGVAGSWLDSIPVMVISGQVKTPDISVGRGVRQLGFQELDIVSMVSPITKYAVTVTDPNQIVFELEKAYYLATHGRKGPVWIDIPLDVQAKLIDPATLNHFIPPSAATPEIAVQPLVDLLQKAERPVLLIGNGVRLSGAEQRLKEFTSNWGIPVLTSWKAADLLDEDDPLYVGRPGSIGQRGANFALQNSDCFISLGARLDFGQIGYEHHLVAPRAKRVIVDIDQAEIDKLGFKIDLDYACDAGDFLDSILQVSTPESSRWASWLANCKSWQKKYDPISEGRQDLPGYVDEYAFFDALSEKLEAEDTIIPGSSGACSEVTMQAIKVKQGQRIFNTQGLGPMGFALPATIGGAIAAQGKRVISVDGDGGFLMNIQELETLKRLQLPIKYFVLNNAGYGSIRVTQEKYFKGRFVACDAASGMSLPSVEALGQAFDLPTFRISSNQEIDAILEEVLNTNGPVLCELMISPEQYTKPRLSSKQLEDGSFKSMPLDDLDPFLDRPEYDAIMKISLDDKSKG